MTYEMIIAQIGRNLGWDGFADQYVKDIKFAVRWAEMQLAGDSGTLKSEVIMPIYANQNRYVLPEDMQYPRAVIIKNASIDCEIVGLEYESILKFMHNPTYDMEKMYHDRILYAIRRTDATHDITIYPAINGELIVTYDALIQEDMDISYLKQPQIHRRFHDYLIDGATYYLAKQEMMKFAREKPEASQFVSAIMAVHKANFDLGIKKYTAFSQYRPDPPIIKPTPFYERPESYI